MKFEEVYGRTRGAEPRRGGGGRFGTHLPALARSLRGGGRGRVVRPPPGPGLGAPGRRGRGGAGSGIVRHPVLGLQRQALSREAGRLPWRPAQLQLGPADFAGPWPRASRSAARRPPAQAPAAGAARRCTRTARATSGCRVGSGRHHGRRHQRGLLGLLRRRGRHHVDFPGASRGGRRARAVLLVLHRPRQPLLPHARGRRQGRQGQPDPGRARPSPARHRARRRLLARGSGALGGSAPCRSACPRNSGSPASPTWPRPTASSSRSTCRTTTGASLPRPRSRGRPSCPSPAPWTTSSVSTRSGSNDNTVRYKGRTLQIPADRHHYVKARVRVHEYPDHTLAVFHGPRRLALYRADGAPFETATRKAA